MSNLSRRIEIDTRLHWKTIMAKYGVGRTVAYASKQRGWLVGAKKKNMDICTNPDSFDVNAANAAARTVFWKYFAPQMKDPLNWIDDCLQEALLRMFELAGDKCLSMEFSFFCSVAKNAIQIFLTKNQVTGVMRNRIYGMDRCLCA